MLESHECQEYGRLPSEIAKEENLPETYAELLEQIKDAHEAFLNDAEGLLIEAIANNDWQPLLDHFNDFLIGSQSEYILTLWKRGTEGTETNGNGEEERR